MIELDLSDTVGLGIIFPSPTGFRYSQQAGGLSCLRQSVEGAYLAIRNDYAASSSRKFMSPELELDAYFTGPRWRGAGATSGLGYPDADFIDRILARANIAAQVDRTRLADSMEAWVWVVVAADSPDGTWTGLGSTRRAVLTWSNSD